MFSPVSVSLNFSDVVVVTCRIKYREAAVSNLVHTTSVSKEIAR